MTNFKLEDIDHIETSHGSIYKYLPDGRTQRFKTATGILNEPADAMVFIPHYKWIEENAPEHALNRLGSNEQEYSRLLISYIIIPGKKVHIVGAGKENKVLEKNREISDYVGQIGLAFGDAYNTDFCLPVARLPKIGFLTYDTTLFQKNNGWIRSKHIGHEVIKISLKSKEILV
jgi:hypothetical protein